VSSIFLIKMSREYPSVFAKPVQNGLLHQISGSWNCDHHIPFQLESDLLFWHILDRTYPKFLYHNQNITCDCLVKVLLLSYIPKKRLPISHYRVECLRANVWKDKLRHQTPWDIRKWRTSK